VRLHLLVFINLCLLGCQNLIETLLQKYHQSPMVATGKYMATFMNIGITKHLEDSMNHIVQLPHLGHFIVSAACETNMQA